MQIQNLMKRLLYTSHVESPIEFFGHTYNKELAKKLDALTKSMEALCPSQPKVIGQLSMDNANSLWMRCGTDVNF